jgi:tetratricopeptide (TPR) repeat protein
MTSHFAEVDIKSQQGIEGVDFTAPGKLALANLNMDSVLAESTEISLWELSNYSAVEWWLTEYKPKSDATNLEKVRGYLEAFHHLCEVEAWEEAREILFIRLDTPTTEELRSQLFTWGYYQEQVKLCNSLLGKLSPKLDAILLGNLGNLHTVLGSYVIAIDYYQQSLSIASAIGNRQIQGLYLNDLGMAYSALGYNYKTIELCQQSLAITQEVQERVRLMLPPVWELLILSLDNMTKQ